MLDIELLDKVVSLSQANIDALREGDLLNLKDDLFELAPGNGDREAFKRELTPVRLKEIQGKFFKLFSGIAEGENEVGLIIEGKDKVKLSIVANDPIRPFQPRISTTNVKDRLLLGVLFLLTRSKILPGQIRSCPECKAIFVLNRKPDNRVFYCSPRCASRVTSRRHWEKTKEQTKPKERERSHKRYKERVERKTGQPTKVPRRPRV